MNKRVTVKTFFKAKKNNEKITMLTAYDYSTAKYLDEAGVDAILIGDSLGMVVLGYENTQKVTIEDMKVFTGAVARGVQRAMVVADMPFLAAGVSIAEGIKNAGELIKAGAYAVKIEGGGDYTVELVKRLTNVGIPVVAHLGFTPQFINIFGGYNVQLKSVEQTKKTLAQAKKLQEAGAFALVLEMVPEESAKYITKNLDIITIGIGAGRYCDGQVLVCDDIFGKYSDLCPKFSKKYSDMKTLIFESGKKYVEEVKAGLFPAAEHLFNLNEEEKEKLNDKACTSNC